MHFLRDIRDLKQLHPDDAALWQWAKDVKQIYERAKAAPVPDSQMPLTKQHTQRVAYQHVCEQELWQVCTPFVQTQAPMHTLCERVERFLPELFVFVAYPGVPSDNNLAERSVRPLVIARKISGGTRSPKGSLTRIGAGEPLRDLDGSRAQSFSTVSRSVDLSIFFSLSLNTIVEAYPLTKLASMCIMHIDDKTKRYRRTVRDTIQHKGWDEINEPLALSRKRV